MRFVGPLSVRTASESISASDWLTLITLCFAPLVVHIISGIPHPVYFQKSLPSWHDKLGFYNPTTIIWRYYALPDRRIRCKNWNSFHMAASNVRFWTEKGWDGSEEMMERSQRLCVRVAETPRMTLMSRSCAETLVVMLQGVQSLVELNSGFSGGWMPSLATLFYPLAVLGLLRLPAAYWISDEGYFAEYETQIGESILENAGGYELHKLCSTPWPFRATNKYPTYSSFPKRNWRGWLIQAIFLSLLSFSSALSIWAVSPWFLSDGIGSDVILTTTTYVEACFYTFTTTTMTVIVGFYSFQKKSSTVILPCVQSLWYKIYTVVLFLFAVVYIIIASLETRKSPCGKFSTLEDGGCPSGPGTGAWYLHSEVQLDSEFKRIHFNSSLASGAELTFDGVYFGRSNATNTSVDLYPWDGWCQGSFRDVKAKLSLGPHRQWNRSSDWFENLTGDPGFNVTTVPIS
ncbi:hypothetical protein HYALB_00013744 [Hymenoscyphus albidus]|uniref:Uncharacterized protein n=1 Tax=Hymenoscyphus albidus TaxID=595503 RepID=A0A9N9LXY7_9HELO|nr:hypothetical protein HYALB_00013744 [Hymenoscyphus albidus]